METHDRTRRRLVLAALAAGAARTTRAAAYPASTVRIVYNFAPGGPGDAAARYLADQLTPRLGQPVIVENKSGGNGSIGIMAVARERPDGLTLLFTTLAGLVQLPYYADKNFDPIKGLQPIAMVGAAPLVILAHPSLPANDFLSFVEWARTQKTVPIAGAGPIIELTLARLSREARLNLEFIPYRGSAPAIQAVLGGEVQLYLMPPSGTTTELVRNGRLKVIGVTSAEPSALAPGVQPIARQVPGFVQDVHYCFWAPAGTGSDVVTTLTQALMEIMGRPATTEKLLSFSIEPRKGGPDEVTATTLREAENIRRILAVTPIKFGQ
jgi:tripartite-type tricarboxylate transporter receptor subunit TctC